MPPHWIFRTMLRQKGGKKSSITLKESFLLKSNSQRCFSLRHENYITYHNSFKRKRWEWFPSLFFFSFLSVFFFPGLAQPSTHNLGWKNLGYAVQGSCVCSSEQCTTTESCSGYLPAIDAWIWQSISLLSMTCCSIDAEEEV